MGSGGAYGCGSCLPCRLKARNVWASRIELEAGVHTHSCFLTLTYKEDPGTLVPEHLQAFMKALRKRVPYKLRFYAVGEYGEQHGRPHYHVALFGHPSCLRPSQRRNGTQCLCKACGPIHRAWVDDESCSRGFIMNLPLETGSSKYIARYVVKKMTRTDDPRLGNKHPEFSRQSNRPGIGFGVLDQLAMYITKYKLLSVQGDVPVTLHFGGVPRPLGRYLRSQLRIKLGLDKRSPHVQTAEGAFAHYYSEENAEMRSLQKAALHDKENPSLKAHVLAASKTAREQLHKRQRLFSKKGKL